jgi:uncharacterized repeat protein (TIGR04138 family)
MDEVSFEEALELIRVRDQRYTRDAYQFVREALDHTQRKMARENHGKIGHVTGQELLGGIREYAIMEFGPMATMVFEEWGIFTCQDFGDIVFNMVDIGLLAKTDRDHRADFEGGYDFFEAFRKPFLPASRQANALAAPASRVGD